MEWKNHASPITLATANEILDKKMTNGVRGVDNQ